jgi:hypothetical protein
MGNEAVERVPENAAGDFYVEEGRCLHCCLPHAEAPELLNDPNKDFRQCYFRRQPQTPLEVEHAVEAIWASDIAALRYGGTDQSIIRKLHERGVGHCCDNPVVGPKSPAEQVRPPKSLRILQWSIVGLSTVTLLMFCWLAIGFIRFPTSQRQFIFGWLLLVLCAFPLASLAWWIMNRRRSDGAK